MIALKGTARASAILISVEDLGSDLPFSRLDIAAVPKPVLVESCEIVTPWIFICRRTLLPISFTPIVTSYSLRIVYYTMCFSTMINNT
jgi:hypothetical protein